MNVHGLHRTKALVALAAVGVALAVAGPAFAEPSKTQRLFTDIRPAPYKGERRI